MTTGATVEIGDLVLRLPGMAALGREEARALGERVARHLADDLSSWRLRSLPGALDLRVTIPANATREQLPALIAQQIARALR
jgi:hypothetical protein